MIQSFWIPVDCTRAILAVSAFGQDLRTGDLSRLVLLSLASGRQLLSEHVASVNIKRTHATNTAEAIMTWGTGVGQPFCEQVCCEQSLW